MNNVKKTITKKDVAKSWLILYAGSSIAYSYERLLSLAYCASMVPVLKKLYPEKKDLSEALQRHLIFYNTEVTLGGLIQGIAIAMEEERSFGEKVSGDMITGVKTGLMGPIAGMGDSIIWAALMPIIIALFLPLAAEGNPLGGIFPLILYPAITIFLGVFLAQKGYAIGRKSILSMLQGGKMKTIIFTVNIVGLMMMGALSASYISISSPFVLNIAGSKTELQGILDQIAPGILPLAAVFSIYYYISKKGPRYGVILAFIVIFSILTSYLGLL